MQISGVRETHRDPLADRGDGILVLVHAVDEVPKTLLLDAPELKQRFRDIAGPLILIVSDHIHAAVVRHGYPGIDPDSHPPGPVVRVGAHRCRGWIHIPAGDDEPRRNAWPVVRVHSQATFTQSEEPGPFQLRPPVLTEERSA